jgi:hypothetical protein
MRSVRRWLMLGVFSCLLVAAGFAPLAAQQEQPKPDGQGAAKPAAEADKAKKNPPAAGEKPAEPAECVLDPAAKSSLGSPLNTLEDLVRLEDGLVLARARTTVPLAAEEAVVWRPVD